MSNSVLDRIDQELSSSTVVRSGMSAYATMLKRYERLAKRDRAAADRQLEEAIVDLAARLYRQSSSQNTELLMFSDGANDCLFDATNERTVLMYGRGPRLPTAATLRITRVILGPVMVMIRATRCRTLEVAWKVAPITSSRSAA